MLHRLYLARVVTSLLQAKLQSLRPGQPEVENPASWQETSLLRGGGLALDSLERIALAAASEEMFHVYETVREDLFLAARTVGDWVTVVEASLAEYDEAVTFVTSGSTGSGRRFTHSAPQLHQEAQFWAEQLSGVQRIVATVPAHHIYGFIWTGLVPQRLAVSVLEARWATPHRLVRQLQPGDALVTHPHHLQQLRQSGIALPGWLQVVTSSAPCPPDVAAWVQAGAAKLWEIYGCTEAGGLGWRNDPAQPYELLPYWQPYFGETEAQPVLLRQPADKATEGPCLLPLPAPDQLSWVGPRQFQVGARYDSAVQVAGNNVYPAAIARRIAEHPMVASCQVRPMETGGRLKALVVLAAGGEAATVRRYIQDCCHGVERPAVVSFAAQQPRNAMGKLADWPLPPVGVDLPGGGDGAERHGQSTALRGDEDLVIEAVP